MKRMTTMLISVLILGLTVSACSSRSKSQVSSEEIAESYRLVYEAARDSRMLGTPYPEVIGYEKKEDGTIKLTIHAVWPEGHMEKAFAHELVIRPASDGTFQYVSNHVIPSEQNADPVWYVERITEEQREDLEPVSDEEEALPELFSKEDRQDICEKTLDAAKACADIYEQMVQDTYPADEFFENIAERIIDLGSACADRDRNMENGEDMERFCAAYEDGQPARVTVFEVQQDGTLSSRTFCHRDKRVQTCYTEIKWVDGEPYIGELIVEEISEIRWTEKEYFIYTCENTVMHGNLREYYRVKSLSDRCRELTDRYLSGLSYMDYRMLVTDWNKENAEDILMSCMFEDIYQIYTGERLHVEDGRIPAELFEQVMTACFPVMAEQVRRCCGYDEDSGTYAYEMIYSTQFEPYGELAEKCLLPIGYQGNNLFCSEWDAGHMEELDYNGLYEYLHALEYGEKLDFKKYPRGVPEKEFETLMEKYLPVTKKQLRESAVYDTQTGSYRLAELGCGNYSPNAFGLSVPEIAEITELEDGKICIRVRAVCELLGADHVFEHELTVKPAEDGRIRYVGNHVSDGWLKRIPEYQYRFR